MKEYFQKIVAWAREHPWLAAGILGVFVLVIWFAIRNNWFGGGGGGGEAIEFPSGDGGGVGAMPDLSDLPDTSALPPGVSDIGQSPEPIPVTIPSFGTQDYSAFDTYGSGPGGGGAFGSDGSYLDTGGIFSGVQVTSPQSAALSGDAPSKVITGLPGVKPISTQRPGTNKPNAGGVASSALGGVTTAIGGAYGSQVAAGVSAAAGGTMGALVSSILKPPKVVGGATGSATLKPTGKPGKPKPAKKPFATASGVGGAKPPKKPKPATGAFSGASGSKTPAELVGKPKYFTGFYQGRYYVGGYPR